MAAKVFTPLSLVAFLLCSNSAITATQKILMPEEESTVKSVINREDVLGLSLEECTDIALKNNRQHPASRFTIEIAEAQHKQSLSIYWPKLLVHSAYTIVASHFSISIPKMSILALVSDWQSVRGLWNATVGVSG